MIKPFSLQLDKADLAVSFDIPNLNNSNGWYCNNLTIGACLLFFLAVFVPGPSSRGFKLYK